MTLKRFLIVISFIIGSVSAGAQVFPVQVSTQLMPPFTPYLSDYTAPGAQKFMVQIRVIDPTLTDYTCKLRITIEGVNVTIRTKQTFVSQPITLEGGGTPQVFYGEDLIEYFNPNALDFSGFSRSQYEQGAKLKEGVYRFSVEVLDYNRSTVVSNKGGAVAWIILNDPPILNLPRNNSRTTIIDPTNIPFTWTPRHTGSPNASFTTEYKFRMVEVWPITRNPYDAFLSQPTLFETTTDLTQIVYGMAEPALLPGRKYAWQVQAVDAEGRDLFKNQGKSEVFVFQYGEALGLPDGLYLQNAGPSLLNIRWEAPTGGLDPTGYRIQYRPHNNRKTDKWYELTATDLSKTIDKLQPETEYEVQVRSELNSQFSNYASPQVFKTSPAATGEFACNSNVQPPPLPTNNTPAPKLKPGDVIKAGGYDVHVRKVTSNGSTYTGEGGAEIPYLMGAKVSVTFKDISVNEQFWLTAGEIKTVWNANSIFLKTIEKDVKSEEAAEVGNTNVTVATAEELVIIEGTIIVTVTKNSDGDIVVYTSNGNEKVLPKGKSYAVVDEAGNGYVVDKEGNIAKTTATEAQDALARGNRTYATNALHFEKGAGTYGYDKKKYDALAQYYQQLDGGQYIDWKSVPSSNTDAVDAVIDGANYDPKNIRFELNSTPVTPSATIGKKFSLNVQGKVDGSVEELLAMHKAPGSENEEVLGKLNVASYDEVHGNLVIVPVNKAEFPIDKAVLATKLTEIYKQAIADWRVSLAAPITVALDEKFNDGESGALTNYTDDMKKVINAYGKIQDNTYYIFLVTNSKSGTTLGYMPRSKQAGFVFVDKLNSNTIVNTIAHELGHGAFNLQHTFKEFPGLAKGSTDNIMDYNNNTGTTLYKHQWDYVHDPQRVIGLFEDDEDAASVTVINVEELKGWEYNDIAYAFLAPSGEVVLVPKTIKSLKFSTGDVANNKDDDAVKIIPFGTLISFNIDGVEFNSMWVEEKNYATRYATNDKKTYQVTDFIPLEKLNKPISKVIIGIPVFSQGGFTYRVQQIENNFTDISKVVEKGYTSRGLFKDFDFLNAKFLENTAVKNLSAPPSFFENEKAIDFIRFYLDKGEGNNPAYGLYLYTHATLLDQYSLLSSCFATGLPGDFLKNIKPFKYTVMKIQGKSDLPYAVPEFLPFPEEFELNKDTEKAFGYLMSKWGEVDVNYYKELDKLINSFKAIEIPEIVVADKTEELLDLFSAYDDLNTDNFNCVFSELSIKNKQNFLKHLLSNNNDDWGNTYEKITGKILETLKEDEILTIFKSFKGNPELLHNAYEKCDNFWNSKYLSTLMYAIVGNWKEANKAGLFVLPQYNELKNLDDLIRKDIELNSDQLKILVKHPKLILLEDEKLFTGTESNTILNADWSNETDQISITQLKQVLNSYGKTLFPNVSDFIDLFIDKDGKKISNLNPLEPVLVMITRKQVTDLGLQLEPGIYAVPSILIYWVNSTQKTEVRNFYLRIALDAVAIALAPVTGGASVGLITLEIGMATADIAFTLTKEELSKNDNETFFKITEYWDKIYATYGITLASVGLFKSAPQIASGAKNTARLIANPKLAGRLIRAKMTSKVKELKDLDVIQLADKIDELAAALGSKWISYGNELKSMASSIRLNAELRYVSLYDKMEGLISPSNDLLISNGNVYCKISKYRYDAGVKYASELRYLRNNTSNVKRIKFVGEIENIKYTDNGEEFSNLFIVEDLDGPNSFFVLTEKEINSGGAKGINNFDEVVKDYRAFKGIFVDEVIPANFFENVNALGTTFDPLQKASKTVRGEIYNYYKQQKWEKIEAIFNEYKLNGGWPPSNGGYNIIDDVSLTKGMKFDRYQEWFKLSERGLPSLGGSFTSPIKGSPYAYSQRALRIAENQNPLYYEIEILKDLPIKGQQADVIPWFGQIGKGQQMMFKFEPKGGTFTNLQDLIDQGYIKITIKSSPNALYTSWVGKVFVTGLVKASLITKFRSFTNIKLWVDGLDEVVDASLLSKLDKLDVGYFSRFEADLSHATYGSEIKALLKESPDVVDAWKKLGNHPNRTNVTILEARKSFDEIGNGFTKSNPHTGTEMFDPETGGYVVTHPGHNVRLGDVDSKAEFTMAGAFAKDGKRVTLLDESNNVPGVRPDASIDGYGVFDFKNISPDASNIRNNVRNKIVDANRQADNIALNLGDNPNITLDAVNQGIDDALTTPGTHPKNIGIVYPDGTTKILTSDQFKSGLRF